MHLSGGGKNHLQIALKAVMQLCGRKNGYCGRGVIYEHLNPKFDGRLKLFYTLFLFP
jgi:hypothetical protein